MVFVLCFSSENAASYLLHCHKFLFATQTENRNNLVENMNWQFKYLGYINNQSGSCLLTRGPGIITRGNHCADVRINLKGRVSLSQISSRKEPVEKEFLNLNSSMKTILNHSNHKFQHTKSLRMTQTSCCCMIIE